VGYCPGFSIRAASYRVFRVYIRMVGSAVGTTSDVQWTESQWGLMQLEMDISAYFFRNYDESKVDNARYWICAGKKKYNRRVSTKM
jgi:hypothetical protein